MSAFANRILPQVKLTLRESSNSFDEEIKSYIDGCKNDLQNAGMLSKYFPEDNSAIDESVLQAIRYYCLSNYGLYNADSEKYAKSYLSLKSTLLVQSKYIEEENV